MLRDSGAGRGRASGTRSSREGKDRGPLHGIPYGAKDLLAAEGAPTTLGRAAVPRPDARRMTPRWSAGCARPARSSAPSSPWSSSPAAWATTRPSPSFTGPGEPLGSEPDGPAARRAVGLGGRRGAGARSPSGRETWGSIQFPAAFCGVTGLRPTYGRVSRHGAMALSWTMDKLGRWRARPEDCGLVLAADRRSGPERSVRAARPLRCPPRRAPPAGTGSACCRGRCDKTQPEVRRNFEDSLAVLREFADVRGGSRAAGLSLRCDGRHRDRRRGGERLRAAVESGRITELTAPEDRVGGYAGQVVLAKDYLRALRLRRPRRRRWTRSWPGGRHRRAHAADRGLADRRRRSTRPTRSFPAAPASAGRPTCAACRASS